jgi:hypothetical protein
VLARGVVEDDVDAQRHPVGAQVARERAQVVHGAQRGLHGAVVRHGVAPVVGGRPRAQQGHQVQVGDPELAQVRQLLPHAGQGAREAVDVRDVAHGLLALEPVVGELALVVEDAQLGLAAGRRGGDRVEQPAPHRGKARILAVELDERVAQLGEEALQAQLEGRVPAGVLPRPQVLLPDLRAHGVDVLQARKASAAGAQPSSSTRSAIESAIRDGR